MQYVLEMYLLIELSDVMSFTSSPLLKTKLISRWLAQSAAIYIKRVPVTMIGNGYFFPECTLLQNYLVSDISLIRCYHLIMSPKQHWLMEFVTFSFGLSVDIIKSSLSIKRLSFYLCQGILKYIDRQFLHLDTFAYQ